MILKILFNIIIIKQIYLSYNNIYNYFIVTEDNYSKIDNFVKYDIYLHKKK